MDMVGRLTNLIFEVEIYSSLVTRVSTWKKLFMNALRKILWIGVPLMEKTEL
jgi:hypothetical protein